MTLEDLADLIRAASGNTNGRIDAMRNETNATLMNIQNDLTDMRAQIGSGRDDLAGLGEDVAVLKADMASVRLSIDLAAVVTAMRREIDDLKLEVADLRRRAS